MENIRSIESIKLLNRYSNCIALLNTENVKPEDKNKLYQDNHILEKEIIRRLSIAECHPHAAELFT
jgi:hypothetical protein